MKPFVFWFRRRKAERFLLMLILFVPCLSDAKNGNAPGNEFVFPGVILRSQLRVNYGVTGNTYPKGPPTYDIIIRYCNPKGQLGDCREQFIDTNEPFEAGTEVNVYFRDGGINRIEKRNEKLISQDSNYDEQQKSINQATDSKKQPKAVSQVHGNQNKLEKQSESRTSETVTAAEQKRTAVPVKPNSDQKAGTETKLPILEKEKDTAKSIQIVNEIPKSAETKQIEFIRTSSDSRLASLYFLIAPGVLAIGLFLLTLSIIYFPGLVIVGTIINLISNPKGGLGNASSEALASALFAPIIIILLTTLFIDQHVYRPIAERINSNVGFLCCLPDDGDNGTLAQDTYFHSGYVLSKDGRYLVGYGTRRVEKGEHKWLPWVAIISIDERAFVSLSNKRIMERATPLLTSYYDAISNAAYASNGSLWMTLSDISGNEISYEIDLPSLGVKLGGIERTYRKTNPYKPYKEDIELETGYKTDSTHWPEVPTEIPIKNVIHGRGKYSMEIQLEKREIDYLPLGITGYNAKVNMIDRGSGNRSVKTYEIKFVDKYARIVSSSDSRVWVIISEGRVKIIDLRNI